jgi:hypothetical protein
VVDVERDKADGAEPRPVPGEREQRQGISAAGEGDRDRGFTSARQRVEARNVVWSGEARRQRQPAA